MPAPVVIASCQDPDTAAAVQSLVVQLAPTAPVLVVVFVGESHDPQHVAASLKFSLPDAITVGCSTAGEIGPDGYTHGGMVAFAFTAPARAAAVWLDDLAAVSLSGDAAAVVQRVAGELGLGVGELDPRRHAFITLVDGMTSAGELFVAAVANAAPGIPLVGGSAGSAMQRLDTTWTFADGAAATGSGVLLLVEPGVPFCCFATHHFRVGEERLIVTGARPDQHLLDELNGWPAVDEYARVAGVDPASLRSGDVGPAALPVQLGFLAGDELYLRGLLEVRGDGFLLGGAVEEGMVLRTAHARGDLLAGTRRAIDDVLTAVGEPAGVLVFECVGRRMHAEAAGLLEALAELGARHPVGGFHTFGEQYGALQVNFTLSGMAVGTARG